MPHLALPTLTAYLRSKGFTVIQRDLNAEVYDYFLSREHLETAVAHLRQEYGPNTSRHSLRRTMPNHEIVQWALANGPMLASRVEGAKSVIRSEAFYEGQASLDAFLVLAQSLQLASLPYYPSELTWTDFRSFHPVDQSNQLLKAVRDPQFNPFLEFFRSRVLKDIERERPDIVGISIPTQGQMLAGMTLASLIKKSGLPCHVTVGGPHITMLREQLPRVPQIFSLIDSAVIGAGEVPLLRVARALEGNDDLSAIPNLIYRDPSQKENSGVRVNQEDISINHAHKTGSEDDPEDDTPDFDGLDLKYYLTPEPILPLLTAHGCYHGKCAFCNVGYGWINDYRQLQTERIVEQMLELNRKYGVRHIFFADEAFTTRNLRHMSKILIEKNSPVNWCGCVRFERSLSKELLDSLSQAGCRMLLFGLETASSPIISHMDKGTELDTISRVLQEGTQAGIWNHTFFFFGFPGETLENAQDTVNFIYSHQQTIHSASPGTFLLERYSPAHLYPDTFGVKRIIEDPTRDLAIYFDYEVSAGMDNEMAETVVSHLIDVIPDKKYGQYYITDPYRLLYASHLHEQGKPLPPWLVPEE